MTGGDEVEGLHSLIRDDWRPEDLDKLLAIMRSVATLKEDLEGQGLGVAVRVVDTPPLEPRGLMVLLTASLSQDLEEAVE